MSGWKDSPSFSSSRRCLNDYNFPRFQFCYSILSFWELYFPYQRFFFEFLCEYNTPYCSGRVSFQISFIQIFSGCGLCIEAASHNQSHTSMRVGRRKKKKEKPNGQTVAPKSFLTQNWTIYNISKDEVTSSNGCGDMIDLIFNFKIAKKYYVPIKWIMGTRMTKKSINWHGVIIRKWREFMKITRVPEKNFQREIFFETNFFGLKYVLKHSESIPKKTFFRNFFSKVFTL